ncbi:WD40 repeat-like protein [Metschnikowia bicuspidata var. bicuspidata NRRL YB-4993]|uniref:WD40 repeat-like protein n=1 Tax=Metschnikowia bicuspidata var. bicuspidata NRRL YB-4993 TaxID=869754 RepID=A0A1A0H7H4_9ASCO|nr:WD40 repeat-like protein [Metschnikowia bicuspidata var. bicuspidata NRRL YB-4993]OBA19930.1 WD40 repeat-like protein [Metschnikowia bicuspidata var. bicuspidata NRRL YB-4993]
MKIAKRFTKAESLLPPCCLRVHPDDHSLVFIGTYKLEKETGIRNGSIEIHRLVNHELVHVNSIETTLAILDLKFNPLDSLVIVLAHSTGELIIWTFQQELTQQSILQITDDTNLVTSIQFSPLEALKILATLTSGEVLMVDLESGESEQFSTTHTLECWTGAFGETGPSQNVVFTGGDDARLIAHDLRTMGKIWATGPRHHDAGVVLILCPGPRWLNHQPNELWTGSYDDNLRAFDLRKLDGDEGPYLYSSLLPLEKQKQNLNGGVWRLIPSPDSDDVLACCMYDGARVLKPKAGGVEVLRYFKGDHESMCYGGDWQDPKSIVTCSFYDNVVQIWLPQEEQ